jgi:predicted HicB family RNase H-like nuclease
MIDPATEPDDEDWDMAAARAKLAPKHDNSKKGRQQRQQRIARAVDRSARDGRSLRSTGRTAQFNFKALPELKPAALKAAEKAGLTLAEWMEEAVTAKLRQEGIDA